MAQQAGMFVLEAYGGSQGCPGPEADRLVPGLEMGMALRSVKQTGVSLRYLNSGHGISEVYTLFEQFKLSKIWLY